MGDTMPPTPAVCDTLYTTGQGLLPPHLQFLLLLSERRL